MLRKAFVDQVAVPHKSASSWAVTQCNRCGKLSFLGQVAQVWLSQSNLQLSHNGLLVTCL